MDHESPEVVEQEMEATRASLTSKVSALEQQVLGTVQNASDTVNNIVETVKTVVPETLTSVKETLSGSVEEVSEKMMSALDLPRHTREHPWEMVGGAAAVGFFTGLLVFGRSTPSYSRLAASSPPPTGAPGYAAPPLGVAAAPQRPSWIDGLMDRLGQELLKISDTAITSLSASLKETVQTEVPRLVGPQAFERREECPPNGFNQPPVGPDRVGP